MKKLIRYTGEQANIATDCSTLTNTNKKHEKCPT